jgi:hypothetical protein
MEARMTLDLNAISEGARKAYIAVGRNYGSHDTLKQADQTLAAYERHAALVEEQGFGPDDAGHLRDARDLLITAGVTREDARTDKKVTNIALLDAVHDGKNARTSAQSLLRRAHGTLRYETTPALSALGARVEAVLFSCRHSDDDADRLATQLVQMKDALTEPTLAALLARRGGPSVVARLDTAITSLRAAARAHAPVPGTPVETARLDLIDGIIVRLARDARRAARATGRRDVADEFALRHIDRHTKARRHASLPIPSDGTPFSGG